ncbi:hypothetical protein MTZ49_08075 [Entomomonas sp. E2T0]|uniref:hypothetical protein n=1 Tax=Entomomonas sp. E2T0 TaxID=2930213 RepID=UPI002228403E|nr:hypothetical protein [Entomomonas sp. E2T0]UYZ82577.1 hypothetical protein MTZ49_08075 [Entomomonas sp. E2T0]
MTIYNISVAIKTNTAPENLYYDMELYKTDWSGNETFALRPTGKHPLQADYKTQVHPSLDISDPPETCYILSIDIYRKVGVDYIKMNQDPITAIMPLKGFQTTDKDWGASREFEYFETAQDTKKAEDGQVNTYKLNISSKPRIFEAKEHPIGDPLDPFTKQKVEEELKIRMTRPFKSYIYDLTKSPQENGKIKDYYDLVGIYPNQAASMFCGPAAFFYCVQKDRPDIYQQVIKELWQSGKTKIGSLKLEADKSVRHPKGFFTDNGTVKIPAIDWIVMASLRDTENTGLFSINSPSAGFLWWNWAGAVTMWGVLEKWFKRAGATKKYDNISIAHSNLQDVCNLNKYIGKDTHVVTLIGSGMLAEDNPQLKNHWIVLEGKLKIKDSEEEVTISTPLSSLVELEVFSWGKVKNRIRNGLTLGEFLKYIYGGMVFTKIP